MAKLTLDQKIEKVTNQIKKEEDAIQASKDKIKSLSAELKTLTAEKEQSFANDIIKLMKSNGISQEELLAQLKNTTASQSGNDISSSSENTSSEGTVNNGSQFSTMK